MNTRPRDLNYKSGIDPYVKECDDFSKFYPIKQMVLADLKYQAQTLPKIPHMNHEKLILDSYREGNWKAVDSYIDFVMELNKEMNPKETLRATIISRIGQYTEQARKCLTEALNSFDWRMLFLITYWIRGNNFNILTFLADVYILLASVVSLYIILT